MADSMAAKSLKQVQREIDANDPPIEPLQIWSIKKGKEVLRSIRILAEHPAPPFAEPGRAWICEELAGKVRLRKGELSIWPEFNLRYVLRLQR
jgi:hypothetical protein